VGPHRPSQKGIRRDHPPTISVRPSLRKARGDSKPPKQGSALCRGSSGREAQGDLRGVVALGLPQASAVNQCRQGHDVKESAIARGKATVFLFGYPRVESGSIAAHSRRYCMSAVRGTPTMAPLLGLSLRRCMSRCNGYAAESDAIEMPRTRPAPNPVRGRPAVRSPTR
jgi:hypothetical protein